jgi:hypothetical protein
MKSLLRSLFHSPSARRERLVRPALEELETRYAPAVNVSVIGGVLTAQCDSSFNSVTVDHDINLIARASYAVINGQYFNDSSYSSIQVNGGAGGTVTNIRANVRPVTVFGDALNDVDNVGDTTNHVQGIRATVLLENEPSYSTVNVYDQGDTAARTVTLSTVQRQGDTSLGQVTGLGAAAIQWDYYDTTAVNLNLGAGASTVNVLGTGVTTNIFNNGYATINIGNGTIAGIQGALNLENEPSYDRVNIYAQNQYFPIDNGIEGYYLNTISRAGDSSLVAFNSNQLGCAQITWDTADTTAVYLSTYYGSSQIW